MLFEGKGFVVTAVDGTGLFDPAAHGLEPRSISTSCYHGHIGHYAVLAQRLTLRDLQLGSAAEPPPLGAVRPRLTEDESWHYRGLALPIAFTGRLLIGRGDIPDRPYLNMGFRPAWMFLDVRELTFQAGALLSATDCSAALAQARPDIAATATRPAPGQEMRDWIDRTFSLSYDYSWPGRPG
ncbi:hypothetical protein GCM10010452_02350 [Crossiella cryophila]